MRGSPLIEIRPDFQKNLFWVCFFFSKREKKPSTLRLLDIYSSSFAAAASDQMLAHIVCLSPRCRYVNYFWGRECGGTGIRLAVGSGWCYYSEQTRNMSDAGRAPPPITRCNNRQRNRPACQKTKQSPASLITRHFFKRRDKYQMLADGRADGLAA